MRNRVCLAVLSCLCGSIMASPAADNLTTYGIRAWKESSQPVRPGGVDGQPFWNAKARRFIYAPAFDFKPVDGAAKYRFQVHSDKAGKTFEFEAETPKAALSPVWEEVPVGFIDVTVTALKDDGTTIGEAGHERTWRAAPFNGLYHQPPLLPYDESARTALGVLLKKEFVNYWLEHGKPDAAYTLNRYPAKIYSALVIGAVTQARLTTGTAEAERCLKLARTVADFMLTLRYPDDDPWAGHVTTYYRFDTVQKMGKHDHMDPANHLTIMGVDAGNAFLDMYDLTHETRYLDAAKKIAVTYQKTQQDNGSWPLYVNHASGKPIAPNIAIPTAMINYFDRLRRDYGVTGLEANTKRALDFVMNGPVKTFDWQGQFEDIKPVPPYENLSREQACDLAIYLFRNNGDKKLADELIRFAEDQFVIWEQPRPGVDPKNKQAKPIKQAGADPANWITPSVQEQYHFWRPIGRSAGIMITTYQVAYEATGDAMYLAKARSLANTFPVIQKEWKGDYPTHFTKYKMNYWLNSVVYPARVLMNLQGVK